MRVATITTPNPYTFFGTFSGIPFWGGGLTYLAAAPGIGKTSELLRMMCDASVAGFPSALGCYEHTEPELKHRLVQQARALVAGPHGEVNDALVDEKLSEYGEASLLSLDPNEDTVRGLEERLLHEFNFPQYGHAFLGLDQLNRVPVVGLTGMVTQFEQKLGLAAEQLHNLARKHNWGIAVAAAIKTESFNNTVWDLSDLEGDVRVTYEPDRIYLIDRDGEVSDCGCSFLTGHTLKNRVGPLNTFPMQFWGERFFPAMPHEFDGHLCKPCTKVEKVS